MPGKCALDISARTEYELMRISFPPRNTEGGEYYLHLTEPDSQVLSFARNCHGRTVGIVGLVAVPGD